MDIRSEFPEICSQIDRQQEHGRSPISLLQAATDAARALRAAGAPAGQAYLDEALETALQALQDLAVEVQRSRP